MLYDNTHEEFFFGGGVASRSWNTGPNTTFAETSDVRPVPKSHESSFVSIIAIIHHLSGEGWLKI